jgi:multidrug resistance efflux pump
MKSPKLLYFLWVLGAAAIMMISANQNHEFADFQGIADTKEVIVSFEKAVEIRNIRATPGQIVKAGDLLVELDRPELNLKINEISHDLERFKSRGNLNAEELKSQIRQLKAKESLIASEFDYKIKQLTGRLDLNKKLATGLKSVQPSDKHEKSDVIISPIELQIEGLKKERELAINRIKIEIDGIQFKLKYPENPVNIQVQSLEKELNMLVKEKETLMIYSQINGVIGSVQFKQGAKVSPFVPILTLYTKSPSYVNGYIHENLYNRVSVGDKVNVASVSGKNITGEVVGVGSRIVEFPTRLRKRPEIQIWGREVQVRIPEDNRFLLGEKVMLCSAENKELPYLSGLKKIWNAGMSYAMSSKHRESNPVMKIKEEI